MKIFLSGDQCGDSALRAFRLADAFLEAEKKPPLNKVEVK